MKATGSGSSAGPRRPSRRWPWRNTSLGRVAGAPFEIPGGRDAAFLTISVGMTVAGPAGDAAAIVAAAETALRQAKDGGGNRICTA